MVFSEIFCDKGRPEVASDIMWGLAVDQVGLDVRVKFDDYRSNCSELSEPLNL